MRAGELCVRDVVTAGPDEPVVDVARRMAALEVGDVIVVEARAGKLPRPIGIVTDRDLVVRVLAHPERAPATTTLAEIMQPDPVTCAEDEDLGRVIETMRAHVIRRIPVVDRDGGLQGVISIDDVIGLMRDELETVTRLLDAQGQGPLHTQANRW